MSIGFDFRFENFLTDQRIGYIPKGKRNLLRVLIGYVEDRNLNRSYSKSDSPYFHGVGWGVDKFSRIFINTPSRLFINSRLLKRRTLSPRLESTSVRAASWAFCLASIVGKDEKLDSIPKGNFTARETAGFAP